MRDVMTVNNSDVSMNIIAMTTVTFFIKAMPEGALKS